MPILTAADYDAVRAAIDTSLGEADLSDAVIDLDLYAGEAERWLLRRDPLALTRSGDELATVRTAAVRYCASLLVRAVPALASEESAGVRYTRQLIDLTTRAAELRQMAEAAIDALITPSDVTPGMPRMFALAHGRRGR